MSTAAAVADDAPKKKKGLPKKLMIMIVAVLLIVAIGGGAAVYFIKKRAAAAAAAEEADGGDGAVTAKKHDEHKVPPTFLPLDPFTVNLADRDTERFAQIGVTFEVEDAHVADTVKLYMPAIRNGVLMLLSHKTSAELLERAGKEKLAREIGREAALAMGYDAPAEEEAAPDAHADKADKGEKTDKAEKTEKAEAGDDDEAPKKPAKKKKKAPVGEPSPVKHVNFSSFIIQ